MASSPTPSLDSIRGSNSIESYSENNYLSDSPLTLSGSSPPASDSAICDEFTSTDVSTTLIVNQHHPISASVSSSSSSSGLSGCGSTGSNCSSSGIISNNDRRTESKNCISIPKDKIVTPVCCTACKSKQLDAVAQCFECVNFLCSNCVTAHEYMHCFNGHNVSLINFFEDSNQTNEIVMSSGTVPTDYKLCSSLSAMLQHQETRKNTSNSSNTLVNTISDVESCHRDEFYKHTTNSIIGDLIPIHSLINATTDKNKLNLNNNFCSKHKNEVMNFYCRSCCVLICKDCIIYEHSSGYHEIEHSHELSKQKISQNQSQTFIPEKILQSVVAEFRGKVGEIVSLISNSDENIKKIKMQYQKAQNEINETYQFFCSMLDERKQELLRELDAIYNVKVTTNNVCINRYRELVDNVLQSCDSIERCPKNYNISDIIILRKNLEHQYQSTLHDMQLPFELDFISNYQSIQICVRNTFGCIRGTSESSNTLLKQPPIARPTQANSLTVNKTNINTGKVNISADLMDNSYTPLQANHSFGCHNTQHGGIFDNYISKRYPNAGLNIGTSSNSNIFAFTSDVNISINPYEKWSNGGSDNILNNVSDQYISSSNGSNCTTSITSNQSNVNSLVNLATNPRIGPLSASASTSSDSIIELTSKFLSTTIYPPKSQIKRHKMIYHCKFGEFGVMEGQFTEPSGVAVNAQNDIIVADTNNHRIQIFDKEGRFKFQFGECGKRDSQLLYPNRVAVVRTSGDIIVTERSPTHQIQIYNQYGQFVRKFGANILQHPRGVTVDNKGRIIVVECKVMRVIIFDQNGNVIQKFGCSKHLEFPNGVVVNDKQEIFISDNRAHCVKVFNYEGQFLRQIGGEGLTNYPIGVGINLNGEILIADNHNNFNLTIFTQEGQMVSALESKVKHAQCFDVALMDDGSVVLASKDYRLYIYRYIQVPPIGL